MMNYKVCIMAAGKGSRVSYSENINKALLPVGEQAAISRIIRRFPKDVEIVIAVGYKAEQIKEFMKISHFDRKITIVNVDKFEGKGTGPGHSLLQCKDNLMCPFIFTSVDTIVLENPPEPSMNWIGVGRVGNSKDYCMADTENELVTRFFDKVPTNELLKHCKNYKGILENAFIGMAGVNDYEYFWHALQFDKSLIKGELQVSNGLNSLIKKKLHTVPFNWFDTGHDAAYEYTNRFFKKEQGLPKPDEFIYFENDSVIKFFIDKEIVSNRVKRASILKGIVPELVSHSNNFYTYNFVKGETLAQVVSVETFKRLLNFLKKDLWKPIQLNDESKKEFDKSCRKFYFNKTKERIKIFYEKSGIEDKEEIINGAKVPKLTWLLDEINWNDLCTGTAVKFHGDTQPENIIVSEKGFHLLDWRQDFGGLIKYGDIYYDLAKLYHALIISHEIIRKKEFNVERVRERNEIKFKFLLKNNLLEFKDIFEKFIIQEGYDLYKVRLLSSLIYLNIAALHHQPYNLLLYYLGKRMLYDLLLEKK